MNIVGDFKKVTKEQWNVFAEWYLRVFTKSTWIPNTISDSVIIRNGNNEKVAYKSWNDYMIKKEIMKRWKQSMDFLEKRRKERLEHS